MTVTSEDATDMYRSADLDRESLTLRRHWVELLRGVELSCASGAVVLLGMANKASCVRGLDGDLADELMAIAEDLCAVSERIDAFDDGLFG